MQTENEILFLWQNPKIVRVTSWELWYPISASSQCMPFSFLSLFPSVYTLWLRLRHLSELVLLHSNRLPNPPHPPSWLNLKGLYLKISPALIARMKTWEIDPSEWNKETLWLLILPNTVPCEESIYFIMPVQSIHITLSLDSSTSRCMQITQVFVLAHDKHENYEAVCFPLQEKIFQWHFTGTRKNYNVIVLMIL